MKHRVWHDLDQPYKLLGKPFAISRNFLSQDLIGQLAQTGYSWKPMAPTYSMDHTVSYRAFACLNGLSELPNRRFDVIYLIGADEIAPMVCHWYPIMIMSYVGFLPIGLAKIVSREKWQKSHSANDFIVLWYVCAVIRLWLKCCCSCF